MPWAAIRSRSSLAAELNHLARYAAVLVCFLAAAAPTLANQNDPFQILILTDFDQRSGPFAKVADSFASELLDREPRPVVMRFIDLNVRDQHNNSAEEVQRLLLERVYTSSPPDLVLALGPPAVAFWQLNSGEAFQNVPLLAAAAEVGGIDPVFIANQWAVIARFSYASQIADIRALLPDTRHIFLVYGASRHERKLASVARKQIQDAFNDLELEISSDLSLDEVTRRASQLGAGSVVYFATMDTDTTGERIPDAEALAKVRAASRVPVFGPFDDQFGQGIVGGRLIQLEVNGRKLAEVAHRILNGDPPPKGIQYIDYSAPQYDWRQLSAWGIPASRLPPGSEVLFQPMSPWKLYRNWIIAIVVLNAALAGLAVLWAIQRSLARRQAVTNFELSKRLITAYEDERRLIARELHDDVSQSLTRLSIDASLIQPETGLRRSEERLLQLQDDLARISRDVHELSYRLHPSMVEDLGLANSLRAECSVMQRHTEALVHVDIQDGHTNLPLPIRLNIYRIAQEALQNATRHSGASRIEVGLHFNDREVSLAVGDNGRGFDAGSRKTAFSLGLASMHERARLAGGTLRIDSEPGQGTRVRLSVPSGEDRK